MTWENDPKDEIKKYKVGDKIISSTEALSLSEVPNRLVVVGGGYIGLEYFGKAANVYGVGSFELTYPNYLDLVLYGKNGDGIWIHGTSEGEPVATRGCISVSNPDFLDLSQFVTLASTPVIIKEEVRFVNAQERNQKQQALLAVCAGHRSIASLMRRRANTFHNPRYSARNSTPLRPLSAPHLFL